MYDIKREVNYRFKEDMKEVVKVGIIIVNIAEEATQGDVVISITQ